MTRVPPHDLLAEANVLGGLMLSEKAWERVAPLLTSADFYDKRHGLLWEAIRQLNEAGTPHDAVTLSDWLTSQGIGGINDLSAYALKLANDTSSAANITAHAGIVRDKSVLRRALDALSDATERCWSAGAGSQSAIDDTIRALMSLERKNASTECTMCEAAKAAFDRISDAFYRGGKLAGVTTGLADLDKKLGGLHPGDLIVIGARPSMGKTSMLLGMLMAAAEKGLPVGMVSGEQPSEQIGARAISAFSRVGGSRLRNADLEDHEWPRLGDAVQRAQALPIWMIDRSSPELAEVTRTARAWAHQHGIKALYVDYLQRIVAPGERRYESVGEVARGLKNLARDLNIPVVVLAQVNRTVESRTDRRPRMGDLADSSEIEKEADQILMLYRDEHYHAESEHKGVAELIVEKNRHGPTGFIRLAWRAETMEFADLSEEARWRIAA